MLLHVRNVCHMLSKQAWCVQPRFGYGYSNLSLYNWTRKSVPWACKPGFNTTEVLWDSLKIILWLKLCILPFPAHFSFGVCPQLDRTYQKGKEVASFHQNITKKKKNRASYFWRQKVVHRFQERLCISSAGFEDLLSNYSEFRKETAPPFQQTGTSAAHPALVRPLARDILTLNSSKQPADASCLSYIPTGCSGENNTSLTLIGSEGDNQKALMWRGE